MALIKLVDGVEVEMTAEEEAQIRAEWAANDAKQAEYEATQAYRDKRERGYPKVGDQLDAIYKAFKHLQSSNVDIGDAGKGWVQVIDDVKSANPKPA